MNLQPIFNRKARTVKIRWQNTLEQYWILKLFNSFLTPQLYNKSYTISYNLKQYNKWKKNWNYKLYNKYNNKNFLLYLNSYLSNKKNIKLMNQLVLNSSNFPSHGQLSRLNLRQNKKYKINYFNNLNKKFLYISFINQLLNLINYNNKFNNTNFRFNSIINKQWVYDWKKSSKIFNSWNSISFIPPRNKLVSRYSKNNVHQLVFRGAENKVDHQLKNFNNTNKIAIRFSLSGRLNGVRMSRKFTSYKGSVNTQTLNLNSNYIQKNIYTKWGILGLRVWNRNYSTHSLPRPKLKKYNPVTPSLRHRLILKSLPSLSKYKTLSNLWKFNKFNKRTLIQGIKKTSGRNNQGRITSFRKGGGHKKLYRNIDFLRQESLYSKALVINIEYNPFNNANIALLKLLNNIKNKFFYIIAPENLQIGDELKGIYFNKIQKFFPHLLKNQKPIKNSEELQLGESFLLKDIPIGSFINNVEIHKGKGSQLARSAGTFCILLKTLNNNKSIIKLPSNKIIEIDSHCMANIGQVSNSLYRSRILGKAGAARWLGRRPRVRGEAMNAVDHPHGGKNHGPGGLKNQPKNRWGKLAKWQPTR